MFAKELDFLFREFWLHRLRLVENSVEFLFNPFYSPFGLIRMLVLLAFYDFLLVFDPGLFFN